MTTTPSENLVERAIEAAKNEARELVTNPNLGAMKEAYAEIAERAIRGFLRAISPAVDNLTLSRAEGIIHAAYSSPGPKRGSTKAADALAAAGLLKGAEGSGDAVIERCAINLAKWYPDNANTNAFCAALRSMKNGADGRRAQFKAAPLAEGESDRETDLVRPSPVSGDAGITGKELWENSCLTRNQLESWTDDDFKSHITGIRHTLKFLFKKLDTAPSPAPVVEREAAKNAAEQIAWALENADGAKVSDKAKELIAAIIIEERALPPTHRAGAGQLDRAPDGVEAMRKRCAEVARQAARIQACGGIDRMAQFANEIADQILALPLSPQAAGEDEK